MTVLLAEFECAASLTGAVHRLGLEGISAETYTAAPLEDDPAVSVLPLVILVAGVLTFVLVFLMQAYATMIGYPVDIGGRPLFSWPAYVPMAFEMGVLAAVATGVIGFLVANGLPLLYDPIDESEVFRAATRDGFFLAVRTPDGRAYDLLRALAPRRLEEIGAEDAR